MLSDNTIGVEININGRQIIAAFDDVRIAMLGQQCFDALMDKLGFEATEALLEKAAAELDAAKKRAASSPLPRPSRALGARGRPHGLTRAR